MQLNTERIRNKQRIYIGGNSGSSEVFNMARSLLTYFDKPADFYTLGEPYSPTDAPIVIVRGGDELVNGKALFRQLDPHIVLIHKITENVPAGYSGLEAYVSQFELLADGLPKAGAYIFFEGDHVATLMGKKEREDVKNIEYTALTPEALKNIKGSPEGNFPAIAGGVKALLSRIGISQDQFFEGLKAL